VSHRNWKLQKVNDYAVGFYIDVDAAFKAFKKKVSTPELAREALLKSGVKKTIRIVLAKETDTFKYVPSALSYFTLPNIHQTASAMQGGTGDTWSGREGRKVVEGDDSFQAEKKRISDERQRGGRERRRRERWK
jgi:hypothetical protein